MTAEVRQTPSVLAVIPARGGSKSVPLKNIRPLGGRPLIAYSIDDALRASCVDRVVVSTDRDEIASVAERWGAEVVRRHPDISGDTSTSEEALLATLDALEAADGYVPDLVVFLQATSPLRAPDDIDRAVETLLLRGADSLFSACAWHGLVWRTADDMLRPVNHDFAARLRRQDAPAEVLENGSIYVFRPWVLRKHGNRLGGAMCVHVMDPMHSFQVDALRDWELFERIIDARTRAPGRDELSSVKLLVLDFDGVLTDNRVLVSQDGSESVWCHRGDGWAIARLKESGVEVVVVSTETNPVVSARCRKLGVDCVQGTDDKLSAVEELAAGRGLGPPDVAYVGNDVNDLACLQWAGSPIAVADAERAVRSVCTYVTSRPGGGGAVREVAEWILNARNAPSA